MLSSQGKLWAYGGFAVQTYDSGEYRMVRGKRQRNRERITVRGLNRNHKSRSEKSLEGGGHLRHRTPRAAAGFLCCPGGEGDADQHGSSHPGTQDCRHHFNHVEERSEFRSQTVAATSSLSIAEEAPSIRRVPSASGRSVFSRCSVRGKYQSMRSGPACLGHRVTHITLCPLG